LRSVIETRIYQLQQDRHQHFQTIESEIRNLSDQRASLRALAMQHLGTPEEAQAKDAIERLDAQLDSLRQERTEARRTYGAVIEQFEYLHKVLANEAHATSVATTAEAVSKAKSVVESAQATIE
jgi:uncharacterized membrane protein YccC